MKTLIIGDSHARFFTITEDMKMSNNIFRGATNHVLALSGATINGFGKRESTLNTHQRLLDEYLKHSPDYLCFALGQVDIELGYYYKRIVKDEKIIFSNYIQETTRNYISSIIDITNELNHPLDRVCVKGVNLPVLVYNRSKSINYTARIITENVKDKTLAEKLTNKLKAQMPSPLELNANHTNFNRLLSERANDHKIRYFDINKEIIDPNNELVHRMFVPSEFDHHLVNSLYIRELHSEKLLRTLIS